MAKIIDGKAISQELLDDVHKQLKQIQSGTPGFKPTLAIVQVGDRGDSNVYISCKIKKAAEIGLGTRLVKLPNTTTQSELEAAIDALNWDEEVDGMILQVDRSLFPLRFFRALLNCSSHSTRSTRSMRTSVWTGSTRTRTSMA